MKTTTIKVKFLNSLTERTRGLIGTQKPYPVLISTRFGIHTFGLKFPIDVLILDSGLKIVKLKKRLKQNRFFFWNPRFDTVLELPEGTIQKMKLSKGIHIAL